MRLREEFAGSDWLKEIVPVPSHRPRGDVKARQVRQKTVTLLGQCLLGSVPFDGFN